MVQVEGVEVKFNSLLALKEFFGYASLKEFQQDWKELSEADKEWFKEHIKEAVQATD